MQFEKMGFYSDMLRQLLIMQLFTIINLILHNRMEFCSFQADKGLSVKKQLAV